MFIRTSTGHINVSRMKWFRVVDRERQDGRISIQLAMEGEENVRDALVYKGEMRSLEEMGEVVPAHPGFLRLEYRFTPSDAGEGFVISSPVVAWKIRAGEDWAEPICPAEAIDHLDTPLAVKYPDGRVVEPFNAEYRSEEEWVQDKIRDRQRETQNQ